jgi:hypothetical protein
MVPGLEPPGTITLKVSRNWSVALRPLPPALPNPAGVRLSLDLHITKKIGVSFDKMVKADGVSVRYAFAPGVEFGAGMYATKPAPGVPQDFRFLAVLRLPFF